jgi:beta-glucanase (GH16 family)
VSAKKWEGLVLAESTNGSAGGFVEHRFEGMDDSVWMLRDDTFPGNLALFAPHNFSVGSNEIAQLTIREERTPVRRFTSAALCSRRQYLYGRFMAEVRASNIPGLITGLFLHRNSPKQEIDIELLGKDTRKMLVNVFYNPGTEGSRLEYGYRGTPTLVDLGFDASRDFHRYEIEWYPTSILWRVDGEVVYERVNWEPTPVPHLPMQFNVNLWHSRSRELAGNLNVADLPATAELRALRIYSRPGIHEEQPGRLFPLTAAL